MFINSCLEISNFWDIIIIFLVSKKVNLIVKLFILVEKFCVYKDKKLVRLIELKKSILT